MAPRGPRLSWQHEMRVVLYTFNQEFKFTSAQRKVIFDIIFQDAIAWHGFTNGVPLTTLASQLHEIHQPRLSAGWAKVCSPPDTQAEQRLRSELKQKIEDVARSLAVPARQKIQAQPGVARTAAAPGPSRAVHEVSQANTGRWRAPVVRGTGFSGSVPLSEQEPIAHWAPETPATLRRKRPQQDDGVTGPPRKRRLTSPVVVVPAALPRSRLQTPTMRAPAKHKPARTPSNTVCKKRSISKSPRRRRDGTIITIPDHEEINHEVAPVSQELAQPILPELLFRWWHKDPDCDRDSEEGFWSRKHHNSNAIPLTPPKACSIDATDILNHMDRKIKETPFISTTDRLVWIVQRIIKGIQAGQEDMYLSVISVQDLDPRAVFHARAFHDAVRTTRGFSNGAQNYRGDSEWLVWRDIPKRAIIHTFKAEELINMIDANPGIARALRLEVLRGREALNAKKLPLLRSHNIALSDSVAALARVALFLGLTAHSTMEQITHIVRDIVEGWALALERESDWQYLAGVFEEELCRQSASPITLKTRVCVQAAFLAGVAAGCGKCSYRLKPDLLAQQQKRAAMLGLASPATIIAHALDAAKLTVMSQERTQQKRLEKRASSQPLLTSTQHVLQSSGDQDEDEEEDEIGIPATNARARRAQTASRTHAEYEDDEPVISTTRATATIRRALHQSQRHAVRPSTDHGPPAVLDDNEDEEEESGRWWLTGRTRQPMPMTPPSIGQTEDDDEGILYDGSDESDDGSDGEWTM